MGFMRLWLRIQPHRIEAFFFSPQDKYIKIFLDKNIPYEVYFVHKQ